MASLRRSPFVLIDTVLLIRRLRRHLPHRGRLTENDAFTARRSCTVQLCVLRYCGLIKFYSFISRIQILRYVVSEGFSPRKKHPLAVVHKGRTSAICNSRICLQVLGRGHRGKLLERSSPQRILAPLASKSVGT